ncbi:Gfo/Idh/MocA family protein [Paenarthrobacter sp. NCHU4564]|uniref:Gfo/Idh/MocA family protein n=1 Tax=Paenarthrobacter sp. NCHU4564 TaxID=3451353 RepID=UPI003F951CA5
MSHTIGIIGAGNISGRYLLGLRRRFPHLELRRIADIDLSRAEALATQFEVPASGNVADLLADDEIDIVVNLTPPMLHARTVIEALSAGKNVYVEKPLATSLQDGAQMLETAQRNGVLLGSAPDTFLGSAGQTARHAVDTGMIGEPIGASAFVRSSRAERWHPDPRFLFQPGGGPVMDMGPYYISALVNCLGPVERVSADTRIGARTRKLTAENRVADSIEVSVDTHASAVLSFSSGAIGTVMMSFDVQDTALPRIEIYGTEGTLSLPDPNTFDGPVLLKRPDDEVWKELEPVIPVFGEKNEQNQRGLGVDDLASAIDGGAHRASGDLAFHVLDVMLSIEKASRQRQVITLESSITRPAAVEIEQLSNKGN